jgi:hypothetical protein
MDTARSPPANPHFLGMQRVDKRATSEVLNSETVAVVFFDNCSSRQFDWDTIA